VWRSFGVLVWVFRMGDGGEEESTHSIGLSIKRNGILILLVYVVIYTTYLGSIVGNPLSYSQWHSTPTTTLQSKNIVFTDYYCLILFP